MTVSFSAGGLLYPRFGELLTKMELDDWIGTDSMERYKLDPDDIDAERINSTLDTIKKLWLQRIRFQPFGKIIVIVNTVERFRGRIFGITVDQHVDRMACRG